MATLFERLTGINLPQDSTNIAEQKMAIHSFTGALNEMRRGKFTGQQVATMYQLTGSQQTAAAALKELIVAAPQKTEFMRVLKDCLYLAECGDAYLTQAALTARLQAEVTGQGGTLP